MDNVLLSAGRPNELPDHGDGAGMVETEPASYDSVRQSVRPQSAQSAPGGQTVFESHVHTHLIDSVRVDMPEFSWTDVRQWLNMLELRFKSRRITSDSSKFEILTVLIPPKLYRIIAQDVDNYNPGEMYPRAKAEVLRWSTPDKMNRVSELVNMPFQSDHQSPSELLFDFWCRAEGLTVADITLGIWLTRIDPKIADQLDARTVTDHKELAERADMLWRNQQARKMAKLTSRFETAAAINEDACGPVGHTSYNELRLQQHHQLQQQHPLQQPLQPVEDINYIRGQRRGRGGGISRGRGKGKAHASSDSLLEDPFDNVCRFHYTHGRAATNCVRTKSGGACKFPRSGNGLPGR